MPPYFRIARLLSDQNPNLRSQFDQKKVPCHLHVMQLVALWLRQSAAAVVHQDQH